ncbi:hypothetical protein BFP72_03965 [Reichenbachiella sp. 5M10]|uniref:HAD family hydrolase n=1 Tax=Reichenbachiella sp. 5M10 TaxID=1889772 RepID=UPI000C14FBA6|nr:HAD family hydrolase [Reichenbachiella sp. 5M10]PIB34623.1 hypothetical protein BFP72_03965 [Reichenbachiella sp. 5M10]
MKKLALFDFDGTITSKDTLFEIAKFSTTPVKYYTNLLLLSPVFVGVKGGWISAQKGKEHFLKMFFGGMDTLAFAGLCERFCDKHLPQIIRPQALKEIQKHLREKTDIYIVSASPQDWIKPWTDLLGISCISTALETDQSVITGKILGTNCNGEEKVIRIRKILDLTGYDTIEAYGDTKGDIPMLKLANTKHFKPFT